MLKFLSQGREDMDTKRKEMLSKFIMRTKQAKSPGSFKTTDIKKIMHKPAAESQPRKPLGGLRVGNELVDATAQN